MKTFFHGCRIAFGLLFSVSPFLGVPNRSFCL